MGKLRSPQSVFEDDEMNLQNVDQTWTAEELLEKKGVFFLKDVAKTLAVDPVRLRGEVRRIKAKDGDPYEAMGVRKIWSHWIIRMKVFAPYYREHMVSDIQKVDPSWDGNTLLQQKGIFSLAEVTSVLPFTTNQLRYQAKRNPNAKNDFGIWKRENLFVVDMERFAPWIRSLWEKELRL